MPTSDRSSRREFVRLAGLSATASVGGLALPSFTRADDKPASTPKPDDVLKKLLAGNKRFANGKATHPRRTPKDFAALAKGQKPAAIIVA